MAEAHIEMFLVLEDLLLWDLLDHFNRYLVPQLAEYNFGPGAPEARIASDGISAEAKEMMRSLVEKVLAQPVTAQLAAEAMDVVDVLKTAGVPTVDEAEMERRKAERPASLPMREAADLARGSRDERLAIVARGANDAADYFDALVGRAKKG